MVGLSFAHGESKKFECLGERTVNSLRNPYPLIPMSKSITDHNRKVSIDKLHLYHSTVLFTTPEQYMIMKLVKEAGAVTSDC